MKQYVGFETEPHEVGDWNQESWAPQRDGGLWNGWGENWWESLRNLWQWDAVAAEISQECQARVALVGLPAAGKRTLFNRLRGWRLDARVSEQAAEAVFAGPADPVHVESYGFFVLSDLADGGQPALETREGLMLSLGEPALVIYLLDAVHGVRPADYRWIATLRAAGKPLVVALNKADATAEPAAAVAEATRRLGMPVIPISAWTGLNVETRLLPALLDAAPRLAAPLGRELHSLRRVVARRLMRQAALLAGMLGAQPVPMLDLPFQAMLQVGVVMRIGAAYGHAPTGGLNRELLGTVLSTLGARLLALGLMKLVPVVGWIASGVLSSATTLLLGEAALRYYEAGGTITLAAALAEKTPRRLRRRRATASGQDPALPEEA
jgi:uncharacterized protein (DUF697 family)